MEKVLANKRFIPFCKKNLNDLSPSKESRPASVFSKVQLMYVLEELGTLSRTFPISWWCTILQWCFSQSRKRRLRTTRPKVVRGDRLACHRTLVHLILSALASRGESSPFDHGDRRGRRIHQIHTLHNRTHCVLERIRPRVDYAIMENNDRTLKELATLDVAYQPWCIQYPHMEPTQTYELKSGLIHLLPKFHGLAREDPHKHLKEFHMVCSTMRSKGIPKDYIKMKVFPFSLDVAAKDWLYLQSILFITWGDMKQSGGTTTIKKEIYNTLEKLCMNTRKDSTSFYFYEGLTMMDRSMIDVASGGALMDKTPAVARHLISNMAIGAVDNLRLENQLTELTSLVRQLSVGQHQPSIAGRAPLFQQQQQRMPAQGNSPSLEGPYEMQIGQLANTVSHLHSAESSNLLSQTIPNLRGNMEKHCHNQHCNSCQDQLMPTLSLMSTYRCLSKTKLSYCRFQFEPSQQGSLNLMKSY
ncbi:hypothetical protein CR513_58237, partial [Mucuna pruriens]